MHAINPQKSYRSVIAILLASVLLLACYAFIWRDFLTSTKLAVDYGLAIPSYLDSYFWFHNNGFAVQWFTPSLCGGTPVFAEPQSGQYSIPTWLSFIYGPTAGVKISFLLYAWLGFISAYGLSKRAFGMQWPLALLAATLFMFNGFYAYRILVSHLFFGLMLTPLLAWLLISAAEQTNRLRLAWWSAIAGVLYASYIYSGGLGVILPFSLSVLVLCLMWAIVTKVPITLTRSLLLTGVFLFVSLALAMPKLSAASAFMANFPRDNYLLPGFDSPFSLLKALFYMLFWTPQDFQTAILPNFVNAQWLLDRHEWEFGVSLAPLSICVLCLAYANRQLRTSRSFTKQHVFLLAILFILAVTAALNLYTPDWNSLIKTIPGFKSSSNLIRYFWVWVVALCFGPTLLLSWAWASITKQKLVVIIALICVAIGTPLLQNKDFYEHTPYSPAAVEDSFRAVAAGKVNPEITANAVNMDKNGRPVLTPDRNAFLTHGYSQLLCYQPIYGYGLEAFPFRSIRPGSPYEVSEPGRLNFKNPACMVFPTENQCRPGDHYKMSERNNLNTLLTYRTPAFELSKRQIFANYLALIIAGLIIIWSLLMSLHYHRSQPITGKKS